MLFPRRRVQGGPLLSITDGGRAGRRAAPVTRRGGGGEGAGEGDKPGTPSPPPSG